MRLSQQTEEWQKVFKKFIDNTFAAHLKKKWHPVHVRDVLQYVLQCPTEQIKEVRTHLIFIGFFESFIQGEGEEKIHLRASVKWLAMTVQQVTVIL
jgi:hypothetical protein